MLRSKFKNYCSKHFGIPCTDPEDTQSNLESEADNDDGDEDDEDDDKSSDRAEEPSNDGSKDESDCWEDEDGVHWKEGDDGSYYWKSDDGNWLPFIQEIIQENEAAKPKFAAM